MTNERRQEIVEQLAQMEREAREQFGRETPEQQRRRHRDYIAVVRQLTPSYNVRKQLRDATLKVGAIIR